MKGGKVIHSGSYNARNTSLGASTGMTPLCVLMPESSTVSVKAYFFLNGKLLKTCEEEFLGKTLPGPTKLQELGAALSENRFRLEDYINCEQLPAVG